MFSKKSTQWIMAPILTLLIITTSLLASCNIIINPSPSTQPESQQSSPSNDTSDDSNTSPAEVSLDFWADDTNLDVGECTMLHWNTSGGTPYINGSEQPPSGEFEICPEKTTSYMLQVENPPNNLVGEEEFTIVVNQSDGNESAPSTGGNDSGSSSGGNSNSSGSQSQSSGNTPFKADLTITDIYPGNQPQGQFHLRVTNNGPGTLNKVKVTFDCSASKTDRNTGKVSVGGSNKWDVNLSIKPGETQVFPTGINLDSSVFDYMIGCEVRPTFDDPDNGNNYYEEPLIK